MLHELCKYARPLDYHFRVVMIELLQGVVNILEAILEAGLGESVRFFEASSCEILGKGQEGPCNEESAMHPQTPYGKAKLLAHLAVKHYRYSSPLISI